jgi:hypothetical protein
VLCDQLELPLARLRNILSAWKSCVLWFCESFSPVLWMAFLIYWQIKAAGTKTTKRLESAGSRILRALTFPIVIVLLSTTRIPLRWLYLQPWPQGLRAFWLGASEVSRGSNRVPDISYSFPGERNHLGRSSHLAGPKRTPPRRSGCVERPSAEYLHLLEGRPAEA